MKRLLVLLGIVGAVAVGAVAVATAGAQEDSPTATPSAGTEEEDDANEPKRGDKFLDGLAENLGISREDLDSAIDDTQIELIDQAVADGKITQERADELKERIESGEPLFPFIHHGPMLPPGGHFFRPLEWIFENSAELLGLEQDALMEQLKDGESLSAIAEGQGIDIEDFKADLLAAAKEDLQAKVDAGDMEQERADNLYEMFENNIDRIVEASRDFELSLDGEGGLREQMRMHFGADGESGGVEIFGEGVPLPDFEQAPFPSIEEDLIIPDVENEFAAPSFGDGA